LLLRNRFIRPDQFFGSNKAVAVPNECFIDEFALPKVLAAETIFVTFLDTPMILSKVILAFFVERKTFF